MIQLIAIGFAAGIISGMGIGGGAVLIPSLNFFLNIEQLHAQTINLLYFLPTAVIALLTHRKKGNLETKALWKLTLFGLLGAGIGTAIALQSEPAVLRKMFGLFLLCMGVYEFIRKDDKT